MLNRSIFTCGLRLLDSQYKSYGRIANLKQGGVNAKMKLQKWMYSRLRR